MLWDIFWKHIQVGFSFVCTKFPHIDDKSQCDTQPVTDDLLKLKNFFFWNLDKEDGSSFIQLHHFLVVSVSNCCSSDTPTLDSPPQNTRSKKPFFNEEFFSEVCNTYSWHYGYFLINPWFPVFRGYRNGTLTWKGLIAEKEYFNPTLEEVTNRHESSNPKPCLWLWANPAPLICHSSGSMSTLTDV